ncbi:MAG: hypothetical protein JOZ25_03575 [Actinobacteria bacterium]|nr:hypothetical protein [Actinomycetota bacterium]
MKKELRPALEEIVCDVCGRTMLKGERAEPYLVGAGRRMLVCELCTDRAFAQGWIRESAHDELPASAHRPEQRGSFLNRLRERRAHRRHHPEVPVLDGAGAAPAAGASPIDDEVAPNGEPEIFADAHDREANAFRLKDPRHVRAVPTNAQVKVERAIEVFNSSEHPRTIAGIARTLGEPFVSASPDTDLPSEVSVVVAWELSWYHFRVDLGDEHEPVTLAGKGEELDELADWAKEWNASADADGRLALGVRSV